MEIERSFKRLMIIAVYFLIFGSFFFFIYRVFFRVTPTCFDGKQNQSEEKVDCGGPCPACFVELKGEDLIVREAALVTGGENKYDVFARVNNPNSRLGSGEFAYRFELKDALGNVVSSREGKGFILPNETKYFIENNLFSSVDPANVDFKINYVRWAEFSGYQEPELIVSGERYEVLSSEVGFAEVYGILKNDSSFDFANIKVNIIIRDSLGKAIAVNSTELMTVNSKELRDFRLLWPNSFPGEMSRIEIEPEANVFDSQNFIKKFFPSGRFQEGER